MTNDDKRYERMGEKAYRSRQPRDSCRFKKPDIAGAWRRGWDAAEAEAVKAERFAAIPRWQTYSPSSYQLCGDAPRITVHKTMGGGNSWYVSVHPWGIESIQLTSTDQQAARVEALAVVRNVMQKRLAKLADVTKALESTT